MRSNAWRRARRQVSVVPHRVVLAVAHADGAPRTATTHRRGDPTLHRRAVADVACRVVTPAPQRAVRLDAARVRAVERGRDLLPRRGADPCRRVVDPGRRAGTELSQSAEAPTEERAVGPYTACVTVSGADHGPGRDTDR